MDGHFFQNMHFFPAPERPSVRNRILPVFLPFSGCRQRCVFCAQDLQTGRAETGVRAALLLAEDALRNRSNNGEPPLELAFFGGTFTALPERDLADCLGYAVRWRREGWINGLRCSTRPDALSPVLLARLRDAGFSLVELGVQSFSDAALTQSRRGYTGEEALQGCRMIKEAGLDLGVQLLPGMPGHGPEQALCDARTAASLAPACVRLYPCLVLEGTALAGMWRQGGYLPWDLELTVETLARSCRIFQASGIPVIRIGLAEEPGLAEHVLAGPRHPSLGSMVRGLALMLYVRASVAAAPGTAIPETSPEGACLYLYAPRRYQGEFWGHRNSLREGYASFGISPERVRWWDRQDFALEFSQDSLPRLCDEDCLSC